jgi:transcriptional regulator with XRE-family HTH domain
MSPEELKALRAELKCTAKELAAALGTEQATVLKWESGELFPTKKYVEQMETLRQKGPSAIPRKAKGAAPSPMKLLADPTVWEIVRKLLTHKKLRDDVQKLAASYPDPAEDALIVFRKDAARSRMPSMSRGTSPYASAAARRAAFSGRCVRKARA